MTTPPKTSKSKPREFAARGFSLVSAIFLLVVLAALGAAMLNISTVQQADSALDVLGVRAYQAARAGVEWGLYESLQSPARNTYCNGTVAGTSGPTSFQLPAGTTLSSFTATVTCTFTPYAVTPTAAMSTQSITFSGLVATVTTATAHTLTQGMQITMTGAVPAAYNGTFTVDSVPSATTFTYLLSSAVGSAATTQGSFTGRVQALDRRRIVATACNQPLAAEPMCPNSASTNTSSNYIQRVVQVEF